MPPARDLVPTLPSVFSRTHALREGITLMQLRGRHLELLSRSVYRAIATPPQPVATCRALTEVLPKSATFSHQTAAQLLGLPRVGRDGLHVTMPEACPRRGAEASSATRPR